MQLRRVSVSSTLKSLRKEYGTHSNCWLLVKNVVLSRRKVRAIENTCQYPPCLTFRFTSVLAFAYHATNGGTSLGHSGEHVRLFSGGSLPHQLLRVAAG